MAREFYIDTDECIACGSCAETCPGCFRLLEDAAHADVIGFDCPAEEIQDAMDNCPVECIHYEE